MACCAACGTDSEPAGSGGTVASGGGAAGSVAGAGAGGSDSSAGGGSSGGATAAGGSSAGGGDAGGDAGAGGAAGGGGSGGAGPLNLTWDWTGVVGTGQSLAVGDPGTARNTPGASPRLTTQPFQNLKLSTGSAAWPVDPGDPSLSMVPLVEPVGRPSTAYPSSWPTNISGETAHSAMGNQLTALVQAAGGPDFVNVHGEVGENGQCLTYLVKGATPDGVRGRAYQATIVETTAITRLAQAAGKTYGVGAIIVTHGECDAGNANYAATLHQLWSDYSVDLPAITGQTEPPLMIVSQQHSTNDRSASTLAQWKIGVDYPMDVVCAGPKYQYPYSSDSTHMLVEGYEQLGEKYAQVYYERVIRGADWQPLQPLGVERAGSRVISVRFHVPVPPLVWEDTFQAPHQASLTEWSQGKGFEVRAGGVNVGISSVEIADDVVTITCASDLPAAGVTVGYALTGDPTAMATPFVGTKRWGQLRDSDPFVGSTTQKAQPNFALAFELPVP